jgi:endoglucanase
MCQQLAYLNSNPDVFVGYVGWSAGAFQPSWA